MLHQLIAAPKHMPVANGLAFAKTHQLGYEIPGFVEPSALDAPAEHIAQWQRDLAEIAGPLALHGPVYDLNPVSLDPHIASVSVKRYQQAANICKALDCRYLVIHSQFNPLYSAANVEGEWLSASIDFWQEFAEEVLEDTPTLTVVIENFMEKTPEQLGRLVAGVHHPQVKACLDTGHANIFSSVPVSSWLDALDHHLVYVHSHNNYGAHDEHRGYRYGTVDMEAILNQLMLTPYKIALALEVFNEAELEESFQIVQQYLAIQEEQMPEKTFLV